MRILNTKTAETLFILGFGAFHFAIPIIFPPNFSAVTTIFVTLRIADFVLPGCFTLAILCFIFYATNNRYLAALLAFLYSGGITFHSAYLLGLFPSVIVVPNMAISIAGIIIDVLSILTIYDYYQRVHYR
jgi:hypothetical protein